MTITPVCPECEAVVDVDFTATSFTDREEFWGAPVTIESVEIEFECDLKCPECGEMLDEVSLTDRAIEYAQEAVA